MNFEKRMKMRGNQKINQMIETPEFINLDGPRPEKKKFPLWAKIAIPSSLGVLAASFAFVVIVSSLLVVLATRGYKSAAPALDGGQPGGNGGGEQEPTEYSTPLFINGVTYERIPLNNNSYRDFINVNLSSPLADIIGEEVTGLSKEVQDTLKEMGDYHLYHIKGSSSSYVYLLYNGNSYDIYTATNLNSLYDSNIDNLLSFFGVDGDYQMKVFDYQHVDNKYSYSNNVYNFTHDETVSIVDGLKIVDSNYSSFVSKYGSASKNNQNLLMGISHQLVFTDGVDCLNAVYYSQLKTINMNSLVRTSFDIEGNDAFTLMDDKIEMDYDPNYDIYENA